MEIEYFVRSLRELSEFVAQHSFKDPDNKLGDWRAIKQELKNGDIQGLVYRKCTEINIIYSDYNEKQVEFFVRMKKQYEPLLDEALDDYCRKYKINYPSDSDIIFTLYFDTLRDFEVFVFQHLLPLGE